MIETIATGLSLAVTATTTIIAVIQSRGKGKKQKIIELAKIVKKLPNYICEAETAVQGEKTGKAKLRYVLNAVQIDCLKANIDYNEQEFTEEIEKVLETPQKKEI